MTSVRRLLAASIGLPALAAVPLHAQAAERAVFLVRLGRDTLAVEKGSFAPGHVESSLLLRTPVTRINRTIVLSASGDMQSVTMTQGLGPTADSIVGRMELTVTGDSGAMRAQGGSASAMGQTLRFVVPRGAVHFANLSSVTIELVLRRARASASDTVSVPLLLPNGQSTPARVTRVGADSAIVNVGGVDIRVHTDAVGRMLGAIVPTQGAIFQRLPGDSPAASWMPPRASTVRVSYDAPAGAPYTTEEMTLRTPAGIKLVGTLTMPAHAAGARVPAVVLITGSGPEDRDEASAMLDASYRPFRAIADTLSRRGVAVLRLDDRGVGGSDAGPSTVTSADFADDIRAALAWLRGRGDVDSTRLGLVGHSEGGMIAPMIAAGDPRVRALVIIAGPSRTGREIASSQRRYAIEREPSIAPEKRDSVFAAAERASEAAYAAPGWLNFWVNYDPLPAARRVRAPTLILQGETDTQVTPEQAAALAAAMRAGGNRDVTVRTFPNMNHLMLEDASGDPRGYAKLPSYRVRRDLLGVMADWLARALASN